MEQGFNIMVLGPPKTGKSEFAASVADEVGAEETLLLAIKPREANSHGYRSRGIKYELFHDPLWAPSTGSFEADGFLRLTQRLRDLISNDDAYGAVIVDPLTDVGDLISHELLKGAKVGSPGDLTNTMAYYQGFKSRMNEVVKLISYLAFGKRPKHVITTCHLKPVREEAPTTVAERRSGGGSTKEHTDKKAQGVLFEGGVLPMIDGSVAYALAGDFDMQLYSDVETRTQVHHGKVQTVTQYILQVAPDAERCASLGIAPLSSQKTIPNNFKALLDLAAVEA